ncbi:MAG TPA: ABC transporter permease [Bryobacteraceae bacterium]|nr:ABC transporter permease [Bryobacteraceae bacterium]
MDALRQDFLFGLRQLRKSPAFTIAAILTLALGIAANATIFSWLSAVALHPVPGADSRDLISVRWRSPEGGQRSLSWPDYRDYCKLNRTLQDFTAASMAPMNLGEGSRPERLWGMLVSANYFDTLGVKPILGRPFLPEEDENPGGHPVAIVSHRFWQTRLGGDPNVIGRHILLNKRPFTIVGVTPPPFIGSILGLGYELWLPVSMQGTFTGASDLFTNRDSHWLLGQARLKPGVDQRQVEADLTAISAQLAKETTHPDKFNRAQVVPIWHEGGGSILVPMMLLLMAVVSVVLLIACANVTNLVLARTTGRRREIAIRLSLGVSRARLIRQLLIENGILSAVALVAAFITLPATMGVVMGFAPPSDFPITVAISVDSGVVLFTIAISVAATLLFGLVPAFRASRPDVIVALKDESGTSTGARRGWLRSSLVVVQVALSLVLLVSAGLFLKALQHATSANPGFDPRNVLIAGVDLQSNGYDEAHARVAVRQMSEKLVSLPGVVAVSSVRSVPLSLGATGANAFEVEGYTPSKTEELIANTNVITPDYFHTMNTAVMAGREFAPSDTPESQKVIVVNQTFAHRYFPGGNALGHHVRISGEQRVIVGVAADSKVFSLDEHPVVSVYFPLSQVFSAPSNFLLRTTGDPSRFAHAAEDAIHTVDPTLPVFNVRTLQSAISASYFGQRMGGSLIGVFGALALVLAAIGLYGVLAYTVTQRTREVGIRMALGSSRSGVLQLILAQGLRLAAVGLGIGLTISFAVTRLMKTLLMDVSPTDPPTIIGVCALLTAVTLLASFLPAYRATNIDPLRAIRHE